MSRLNPGCWIAHAFNVACLRGEVHSLAFIRRVIEAAPTFPETWTAREGADYVAMMEGR